jgi:DNA-binding NtrC family response regulator
MATILLVDDDPLQASVRKSILERKYSDVRRVGDAAEALCLVEQPQFAQSLRLIVASGLHSGIGLADFISELHIRMPNMPILVIGDDAVKQGEFTSSPVHFVQRPITAERLLEAVKQKLMAWNRNQLKTA